MMTGGLEQWSTQLQYACRKQVYAIVHNGQGNFLIALKRQRGYFFHDPSGVGGTTYPPPHKGIVLKGAAQRAFPGGKLEADTMQDGALTEFFEETNVQLTDYEYRQEPDIFERQGYCGVYFTVGDKLNDLRVAIQANLAMGNGAAVAVQKRSWETETYDKLRTAFQGCPQDNELDSIYEWNLINNWATIEQWSNPNSGLDWYFYILENLKTQLGI